MELNSFFSGHELIFCSQQYSPLIIFYLDYEKKKVEIKLDEAT